MKVSKDGGKGGEERGREEYRREAEREGRRGSWRRHTGASQLIRWRLTQCNVIRGVPSIIIVIFY